MQFARYAIEREVFNLNIPLLENITINASREDQGAHCSHQAPLPASVTFPAAMISEVLKSLESRVYSDDDRLALCPVRGANFQHYLRDDVPRVEAFDRLNAQISAGAASAAADHNNQWSVATYVLGAMSDGGNHTEMVRSFKHLSGNELLQSIRNFLSAQVKEAPRGSSSLLFQRAPGGPTR
ncbi:hypothetical protein FVE85_3815 [Porphyridium purpureum]|uniref:Uncharacterized protein n=1 Tax=Porphyridium purpureum TaxID=35688 RepID=A0A5J4YGN3_PORPP|nr:hypothetical protein FVE85_3815 [Porphyridium purpureum]|eukprot:POR3059..scf243_20